MLLLELTSNDTSGDIPFYLEQKKILLPIVMLNLTHETKILITVALTCKNVMQKYKILSLLKVSLRQLCLYVR